MINENSAHKTLYGCCYFLNLYLGGNIIDLNAKKAQNYNKVKDTRKEGTN